MPSISFLLKGTGALLMLHAAYSCMHYRSILMDLDLLDSTTTASSSSVSETTAASDTVAVPPMDVYIELALAFGLLLLGELLGMGPLQSVELLQDAAASGSSHKPLVAPAHKTRDFDVYSNRSKILLNRATAGKTR
jgi:hypothetical protein